MASATSSTGGGAARVPDAEAFSCRQRLLRSKAMGSRSAGLLGMARAIVPRRASRSGGRSGVPSVSTWNTLWHRDFKVATSGGPDLRGPRSYRRRGLLAGCHCRTARAGGEHRGCRHRLPDRLRRIVTRPQAQIPIARATAVYLTQYGLVLGGYGGPVPDTAPVREARATSKPGDKPTVATAAQVSQPPANPSAVSAPAEVRGKGHRR